MSLPSSFGPPSEPSIEALTSEAFGQLYADYFDAIYWFCRVRLGDDHAAEDAASQVFINAFKAGPRYKDPSLRSWLFCIAHNVVISAFRANRPERIPFRLEVALDIADDAVLPEEAAIAEEERRTLRAALSKLPDVQRHVIELRLTGLTGPQIAARLGRSHDAIKMLQSRAFERLRDLLRVDPDSEERNQDG
jgi:RNA polymerase sigma-70 factor (ECF subfamily)